MIKKLGFMAQLLIALIICSASVNAQSFSYSQSSPTFDWKSIENENVFVIYPEFMSAQSVYFANLIKHYGPLVGQTYGITNPEKFTLVIRPEMASPNGFVTIMPKRSEWFTSANFMPFVGASEWYQTLSIHEYRHLVQFDYFSGSTVKFFNLAFGDMGKAVALYMGLRPWFMEGDAVWAETKYTDAGRGRSPRFMERFKALVLSNKIPTFNQFVNGTYNNSLPNHYVFGYALVSYGTKKYGENFWSKVVKEVSDLPHMWRLYSAIESVSGISFSTFYNEAIADFKMLWQNDMIADNQIEDYREEYAPQLDNGALYYLKYNLNSHWTIVKKDKNKEEEILEIPFRKESVQFSVAKSKAIYNQYLPDLRYSYRNYSDLVLVDLERGVQEKITNNKRLFNPRLHYSGTKVMAIEFKEDQKWNITEFSLEGKILNSFDLGENKPNEVHYSRDEEAIAIVSSKTGHKSIVRISLKDKKIVEELLPASRNNLFNLFIDEKNTIFFEAQYLGYNEIFSLSKKVISQCTFSKIATHTPAVYQGTIYVSEVDTNGSTIKSYDLDKCSVLKSNALIDFNYLSDNASDDYNKFSLKSFEDQAQLYEKDHQHYDEKDYSHVDKRLFIPHSWSFIGTRGYQVNVETVNYLNTLSMSATVGEDSEEKTTFADFSLNILKYYPVFSLQAGKRERAVNYFGTDYDLSWQETSAGIKALVPFVFAKNLYSYTLELSGSVNYLKTEDYKFVGRDSIIQDRNFLHTSGEFYFVMEKDKTSRSIISPWSFSQTFVYENARNKKSSLDSSYRLLHKTGITAPGFFANNGFRFTFSGEKTRAYQYSYKFAPMLLPGLYYVFSRGYDYENVPEYQKVTGDYYFPLFYPDLEFGNWFYLKRIYASLFFDSTRVTEINKNNTTLNSYGLELNTNTILWQIFPLNLGGAYIAKSKGKREQYDFFIRFNLDL